MAKIAKPKRAGKSSGLWDELAYARDDIRQKLVEEPWFGKAVTPQMTQVEDRLGWGPLGDQEPEKDPSAGQSTSNALGWFRDDRPGATQSIEREREDEPDHDQDPEQER